MQTKSTFKAKSIIAESVYSLSKNNAITNLVLDKTNGNDNLPFNEYLKGGNFFKSLGKLFEWLNCYENNNILIQIVGGDTFNDAYELTQDLFLYSKKSIHFVGSLGLGKNIKMNGHFISFNDSTIKFELINFWFDGNNQMGLFNSSLTTKNTSFSIPVSCQFPFITNSAEIIFGEISTFICSGLNKILFNAQNKSNLSFIIEDVSPYSLSVNYTGSRPKMTKDGSYSEMKIPLNYTLPTTLKYDSVTILEGNTPFFANYASDNLIFTKSSNLIVFRGTTTIALDFNSLNFRKNKIYTIYNGSNNNSQIEINFGSTHPVLGFSNGQFNFVLHPHSAALGALPSPNNQYLGTFQFMVTDTNEILILTPNIK